jgi:uncharacterized SAM-binding protein YcdF (DUF218 family)
MKSLKKYFLVLFITILFLAVTIFTLRQRILLGIGVFLIVQDPLHRADVMHVFAWPDHRSDYAIHLYKLGYEKRIFFTGGWCLDHHYYHREHSKERALEQGIPLEAIVTDDFQVTSTYSEIARLREFIGKSPQPIDSILAVSDPHHMRRVRWAYRQVLGKSFNLTMAPVPFDLSPYRTGWWTERKSKGMVEEEYLKLAYYIARYQLSWGFLEKWLASFEPD